MLGNVDIALNFATELVKYFTHQICSFIRICKIDINMKIAEKLNKYHSSLFFLILYTGTASVRVGRAECHVLLFPPNFKTLTRVEEIKIIIYSKWNRTHNYCIRLFTELRWPNCYIISEYLVPFHVTA